MKSRSKYFNFITPNIGSSLVLKGRGVVALVPYSWRDSATYVYFPDGWIIKEIVSGNLNRTFIKVASMYMGQRVLVRKL